MCGSLAESSSYVLDPQSVWPREGSDSGDDDDDVELSWTSRKKLSLNLDCMWQEQNQRGHQAQP